eukprot:9250401-Karenia_brevis.AAC.1
MMKHRGVLLERNAKPFPVTHEKLQQTTSGFKPSSVNRWRKFYNMQNATQGSQGSHVKKGSWTFATWLRK